VLSKQFTSLVLSLAFGGVGCGGSEEHSPRTSEVTSGGASDVKHSGGSGPVQSRTSLGGSNPLVSKSTLAQGGTFATGSGGVNNSVIPVTSRGGSLGTGGSYSTNNGGTSTGGSSTGGTSTSKPPTGGTSAGTSSTCGSATGGAPITCMAGPHQGGGTTYTTTGSGNIAGGYHHDSWSDGIGSFSMTVYEQDATFKAAWNNVGDFLARVGLKYRTVKRYDQYDTISAEFAELKSGNSACFIGVHGWMENPNVEYTIIEDWCGTRPTGSSVGTFNIDDGTYDMYHETIHGDPNNIERYLSVRRVSRQCGHVSVSEHFKQWTNFGAKLSNLVDTKLFIEALRSGTGSVEFTAGTVTAQ
jgi:Glycosyl hydrolases family 11